MRRFHKGRKAGGFKSADYADCNVCSNGCGILLWRKAYYKQRRQYYGGRGAFKPLYLRYADSFQPYDGINDICYDNNIKRFYAAYL